MKRQTLRDNTNCKIRVKSYDLVTRFQPYALVNLSQYVTECRLIFTQSEQVAPHPPQEPQVRHQTPVFQAPATGQEVMVLSLKSHQEVEQLLQCYFWGKRGTWQLLLLSTWRKSIALHLEGPRLSFSRHQLATSHSLRAWCWFSAALYTCWCTLETLPPPSLSPCRYNSFS